MDTFEKLKVAFQTAIDKKAEEPVILDLTNLGALSDYFLIVSALSDTHGKTLADEITKKLKEHGAIPVSIEGYDLANWILIDYGDIIIHIFKPEIRELYGLENLWIDAPQISVEEITTC